MRGGATPDPLPRRRGGGEQGAAQRITRAEEARRRVRGARAIYRLSPVHSAGSLWDAPCHIYQRNCAIPTAIPLTAKLQTAMPLAAVCKVTGAGSTACTPCKDKLMTDGPTKSSELTSPRTPKRGRRNRRP